MEGLTLHHPNNNLRGTKKLSADSQGRTLILGERLIVCEEVFVKFVKWLVRFGVVGGVLCLVPAAFACCTCPEIGVIEQAQCNDGKGCFGFYSVTGCDTRFKTACEKCIISTAKCCNFKEYQQATGPEPCPAPAPPPDQRCRGGVCWLDSPELVSNGGNDFWPSPVFAAFLKDPE